EIVFTRSDGENAGEQEGSGEDDADDEDRVDRLAQVRGELFEATPEPRAAPLERSPIIIHPARLLRLQSHSDRSSLRPFSTRVGDETKTIQRRPFVEFVTAPCSTIQSMAASSAT